MFAMLVFPSEPFMSPPSIKRPAARAPTGFVQRAKTHFEHDDALTARGFRRQTALEKGFAFEIGGDYPVFRVCGRVEIGRAQ